MTWDLKLNSSRDLTIGVVTGLEEIVQRLITRLNRELGEWFLNTSAGLPWYQDGEGILGSRNTENLKLIIRKEVLATTGVERIISLETNIKTTSRQLEITLQILTIYGAASLSINEEGAAWRA